MSDACSCGAGCGIDDGIAHSGKDTGGAAPSGRQIGDARDACGAVAPCGLAGLDQPDPRRDVGRGRREGLRAGIHRGHPRLAGRDHRCDLPEGAGHCANAAVGRVTDHDVDHDGCDQGGYYLRRDRRQDQQEDGQHSESGE